MTDELTKLLEEMDRLIEEARADVAQSKRGNKSAMRRLRKFTLEMGNHTGKRFRKASV